MIKAENKTGRYSSYRLINDLYLFNAVGFYPMQKSVFITPYPCRDEVDFLIEIFDVRPFVRFVVAREIDIGIQLKDMFDL